MKAKTNNQMGSYNMVFSNRMGLSYDNRKADRNANVVVLGGSGSGKTFRCIKPNIAQGSCSKIVTDPSGELFQTFAPWLISEGYGVYLFSVQDFDNTNHYNPLSFVYDARGRIDSQKVDVLISIYLKNATESKKSGGGDPFWEKAELGFMKGMCYYILENDAFKPEDKNFHTFLELVQLAKVDESGADNELTEQMKAWKQKMDKIGRKVKALEYYETFLLAPEKTANSILISTAVDLQLFSNDDVARVTSTNVKYPDMNINIDQIAQSQSYLFLCIPQAHQTYNFLISMLYSQMFARLYELGERSFVGKYYIERENNMSLFNIFDTKEIAENFLRDLSEDNIVEVPYINGTKIYYIFYEGKVYKKSFSREALVNLIRDKHKLKVSWLNPKDKPMLPIHVEFLLDEFKNIGEIPNFLSIIATCRKYRIGVFVVIQSKAQLQELYEGESWRTVFANCDTTLYLGSPEPDDREFIQKMLGKRTIMQKSTTGGQGGASVTYTPTEVNLMEIDEIADLNSDKYKEIGGKCIVCVRDIAPLVDTKLNFLQHKNFQKIKSANFDVRPYFDNVSEAEIKI